MAGDIKLSANFEVNAAKPIDGRFQVADIAARDAIVFKYEGLVTKVVSTGLRYEWDGSTWNELGGSDVELSDDIPESLGTASSGTSEEASRSDHVHPMPSLPKLLVANSSGNSITEVTENLGTYTRQYSTSSSNITLYVTSNGSSGGTPLFANLNNCAITVSVLRDTDANNEAPWVHLRQISNGNGGIEFQIKKSNQGGILLGGTYYGSLNNSNTVTVILTVHGELAS